MGEYAEMSIDEALAAEDVFHATGMTESEYREHYGFDWEPDEPMSGISSSVAFRRRTPGTIRRTVRRKREKMPGPCRMVWETRDRKKIRVCSMPDSHLLNAILYVERNALLLQAQELAENCGPLDFDDMPAFTAQTAEEFLLSYVPYRRLYNEARRRKLVLVPIHTWYGYGYDAPLPPLEQP
jgi:hypothetical protein